MKNNKFIKKSKKISKSFHKKKSAFNPFEKVKL